MTTALYRHFDANGVLLYVGISSNLLDRVSGHKRSSWWWDRISRIEVEHYLSREEALAAEERAIKAERPLHNKVHNHEAPTNEGAAIIITVKIIEAALRKGDHVTLRDTVCPGLRLHVGTHGATWSYRYRRRGLDHAGKRHQKKMISLGSVTRLSPNEARLACETIKQMARDGIDIDTRNMKTQHATAQPP